MAANARICSRTSGRTTGSRARRSKTSEPERASRSASTRGRPWSGGAARPRCVAHVRATDDGRSARDASDDEPSGLVEEREVASGRATRRTGWPALERARPAAALARRDPARAARVVADARRRRRMTARRTRSRRRRPEARQRPRRRRSSCPAASSDVLGACARRRRRAVASRVERRPSTGSSRRASHAAVVPLEREPVRHADEAGDVLASPAPRRSRSGVPSCSSAPARMIASRSPRASASAWSWVTYTAVKPSRLCSSWISVRTWSRSRASRLLSGSSKSTSSGRATRPRASATRCCWPPLSCAGIAVEQGVCSRRAPPTSSIHSPRRCPVDPPRRAAGSRCSCAPSCAARARTTGRPCRCCACSAAR